MVNLIPAAMNYRNEKAAQKYDKDHIYNWRGKAITFMDNIAIRRSLKSIKNIKTLLDIPCGTGRVLQLAAKYAESAVGSDISFQMMKMSGKKNIKGVYGYVNSDILYYAFKNSSVDVVISNRFYTHLPVEAKKNALINMALIAKRYVIIEEAVPGFIARLRWKVENLFGSVKTLTPWHTSTWGYINECAKEANLSVVKIVPRLPWLLDTYLIVLKKYQ